MYSMCIIIGLFFINMPIIIHSIAIYMVLPAENTFLSALTFTYSGRRQHMTDVHTCIYMYVDAAPWHAL